MTRLLEQALATVSALPDHMQDEAAHMLLQFAGVEPEPYALSRQDHADERLAVMRARIRASLDDPRSDLTLAEVDAHTATLVAKAERIERNAAAKG
jgi:hypothetical protein